MAKPIETLSPTDEAIFRTATLKSLQGAAEDPDRIGAEYMPSNSLMVNPGSSVIVDSSGTDTQRGTALVAAYAAAKLLTPNGAALSATNRASVIIPPGAYKLSTTLTLDANFVDLMALIPERGGERLPTDHDFDGFSALNDLATFRPPSTYVYSDVMQTAVRQTATNVRLNGFGIALLATSLIQGDELAGVYAFQQGDIDNSPSYYQTMYFWSRVTSNFFAGACGAYRDFGGVWVDCIGNALSFVIGKGTWLPDYSATDAMDGVFRATMIDCVAGSFSFIGDGVEGGTSAAQGAKFYRCRSIGTLDLSGSGYGSFGSCGFIGTPIDANCYFEECEGGDLAYGIRRNVAGTFVRCRGGDGSFASNGVFSGVALDCVGGNGSFGGRYIVEGSGTDAGDAAYLSGTLDGCTADGSENTRNLLGGTVRNSRLTTTAANIDGVKLLDSNSSIANSDIIVLQGGTGLPINAASARNVSAYGCRMNNASNDADGLGSNVTNLVTGGAGNVVSNAVK